jgi:hypothetical protein
MHIAKWKLYNEIVVYVSLIILLILSTIIDPLLLPFGNFENVWLDTADGSVTVVAKDPRQTRLLYLIQLICI